MGEGRHPDGRLLDSDSRSLCCDGRRLLPVMGECHYARLPRDEWPRALGALRAAGIDIVASYVVWIHHEEEHGVVDWSDRRDLRAFVQQADAAGLQVWLRPGPFVHGEVRNGGFPDWLCERVPPGRRGNDAWYLSEVARWYAAVGVQVRGQLWRDGGPVVGLQLDNEFMHCGGRDGAAHLQELKRLAVAAGLDVPWYTVTGWGTPAFLDDEVLPVFGAYPDAPWLGGGNVPLAPSADYLFDDRDRRMRAHSTIGSDLASGGRGGEVWDTSRYPFLTCELGPGNQIKTQRRPVIAAHEALALAHIAAGSGANLVGWYMFVGGINPPGRHSTLEEPGYPVVSYDFLAPLDESLRARPVYHSCRVLHRFLATCGEALAAMVTVPAGHMPAGPEDVSLTRAVVRSDGHSGFVFLNTCQRGVAFPPQRDVRLQVQLAERTVTFPPVDLPPDACPVWPCEIDLDGIRCTWATAQPFARLQAAEGDGNGAWVFAATAGVPASFHLRGVAAVESAPGWRHQVDDDGLVLTAIATGPVHAARLRTADDRRIELVVLDADQARQAWVLPVHGRPRLLVSDAPLLHVDARDGSLVCADLAASMGSLWVWPDPGGAPLCDGRLLPAYRCGAAVLHPLPAPAAAVAVAASPLPDASRPAHPSLPPDVVGSSWRIDIDLGCLDQSGDLVLRLDLSGGVAQLCAGAELLTDTFPNGEVWEIALRRYRDPIAANGLVLHLAPLDIHDAVYLPWDRWPDAPAGRICALHGIDARFRPELRLRW